MCGKLIIISGFSGSGKGTIVKELFNRSNDFCLSISATTRSIRKGEKEGVSYFFVPKDKFEDMIKNNELLEYAKYIDNYYGTPKKYVLEKLDEGKNVILEIEIQGALQIKKIYKESILIFIIPPNAKILYDRLKNRGTETDEMIKNRLKKAIVEAAEIKNYDYVLVNDNIDNVINNFFKILDGEYKNAKNVSEIIDKILFDIKNNYS